MLMFLAGKRRLSHTQNKFQISVGPNVSFIIYIGLKLNSVLTGSASRIFLLFACWVIFMILLSSADFFKINFEKHFQNTIRVSNGLDPYQYRHFVGSDLSPNCFAKVIGRRQRLPLAKKAFHPHRA